MYFDSIRDGKCNHRLNECTFEYSEACDHFIESWTAFLELSNQRGHVGQFSANLLAWTQLVFTCVDCLAGVQVLVNHGRSVAANIQLRTLFESFVNLAVIGCLDYPLDPKLIHGDERKTGPPTSREVLAARYNHFLVTLPNAIATVLDEVGEIDEDRVTESKAEYDKAELMYPSFKRFQWHPFKDFRTMRNLIWPDGATASITQKFGLHIEKTELQVRFLSCWRLPSALAHGTSGGQVLKYSNVPAFPITNAPIYDADVIEDALSVAYWACRLFAGLVSQLDIFDKCFADESGRIG